MRSPPIALLALLLLAGCGRDDEIRLYWVPKQAHDHAGHDHAGHDHAGHDHGAAASAAPAGEEATWSMPAGWELDPTPRAMRYATLLAGPLEVAVTQFPGRVGTVVQNVERWRRQLGLPPAPPHELEQAVTALEHPEAEAAQVDLRHADDDVRMWVAQLHRPRGHLVRQDAGQRGRGRGRAPGAAGVRGLAALQRRHPGAEAPRP